MTVPVVAFFNNKGGVGMTLLVYHLAWMYSDLGRRVLAADLDPQANLTAAFLDEDRLEELWGDGKSKDTVFDAIEPLLRGVGDIAEPHCEHIDDNLHLLVGNLALSRFEDDLSQQWPHALAGKERAFRVLSAFWRLAQNAAKAKRAELVLVDLGTNLGAINRAALIASDFVVIPLAADLFSLQGLKNLGPTLCIWREEWAKCRERVPYPQLQTPEGRIEPIGYVVLQHAVRLDRPVCAYERWIARVPSTYSTKVIHRASDADVRVSTDPNCLGLLKNYRSLMPMAQEARKPMFHLQAADGALGAHAHAVGDARRNFEELARKIAERTVDRS